MIAIVNILPFLLGNFLLDVEEEYEGIDNVLKISIGAFSLLLFALSISAYKKTGIKQIVYAAAAFALFAVQLFYEYLQDTIASFETAYSDIIFYAITLAILVLFFLTVVRRKSEFSSR